jgi:hypothetical protein
VLAISREHGLDLPTNGRFLHESAELLGASHAFPIELEDRVAGLDARVFGRTVSLDLVDNHAARRRLRVGAPDIPDLNPDLRASTDQLKRSYKRLALAALAMDDARHNLGPHRQKERSAERGWFPHSHLVSLRLNTRSDAGLFQKVVLPSFRQVSSVHRK